jgi:hypothetical protein
MLVLDTIEILPPFGKYKYDTWRILPVTSKPTQLSRWKLPRPLYKDPRGRIDTHHTLLVVLVIPDFYAGTKYSSNA